jgi:AraC-like DNA-binding protein
MTPVVRGFASNTSKPYDRSGSSICAGPTMMYQMPFDWIMRHTSGVVRQGLSFEKVMEASLIDVRHGDNRDLVRPAQFLLLCMNTALGVNDAAHGLARSRIDPAYTALGLRVALGSATLEDAILAVARLYRTAAGAVQIELKTTQDYAILSIRADSVQDADAIVLEDTYLSWIFMHCMYFLGNRMTVTGVSTRDPFHFNLGGRHFAIGAPLRFGSVTSMQFPRLLLGRRGLNRAGANPHWDCFRLWLDFIEHGDAAPTMGGYLTARGHLHLEDIAERAGRSASTIRRRLRGDGGFRRSRSQALAAAAVRKLRNSDDSVDSIAAELGYSDARSLRRFLKTATGATPQQIRASGFAAHPDDTEARRRLQAIGVAMAS